MAQRKSGALFSEAVGKVVDSIGYEENSEWQALVITFTDGKIISFEFNVRVTISANYLENDQGELKLIRDYGRLSENLIRKG